MIVALLLILLIISISFLVWGFAKRERFYTFPFLSGLIWLGFILPGFLGVYLNRNYLQIPEDALFRALTMTILCALACFGGWQVRCRPFACMDWTFSDRKLEIGANCLVFIGAMFYFVMNRLPDDVVRANAGAGTGASGILVAYHFFSKLLVYGFVLNLLLYLKHRKRVTLCILFLCGIFFFDRIIIAGRRGVTFEFLLSIALALYFYRGYLVPRKYIVIMIFGFTIALPCAGLYRNITKNPDLTIAEKASKLIEADYSSALREVLEEGGGEIREMTWVIQAAHLTNDYDYGLYHWNLLVFNFVPAQIVGSDVKESLKLDIMHHEELAVQATPYVSLPGCTPTGMADCFRSFWYFGFVKFLIISFIMHQMYINAKKGNIACQVFYILLLTEALLSITHLTQRFVSSGIHLLVFTVPVFYLARQKAITCSCKGA